LLNEKPREKRKDWSTNYRHGNVCLRLGEAAQSRYSGVEAKRPSSYGFLIQVP